MKISMAKKCHPVSLLSVVRKILEKLENNKLVDHLEKYGLLDQLHTFWHLYLIELPRLLVVLNGFDRVWQAGLFHKLKSYRILGRVFRLVLSCLSNRLVQVVMDGKSLQD